MAGPCSAAGAVPIGEPDVVELDAAGTLGVFGDRGRSDLGRRVEQLENALARRHGRLQDVVLFAEVLNGPEEALGILNEGDQHAKTVRQRPRMHVMLPPNQMTQAIAIDGKNFHHRVIDGVRHDRVFERVHVDGVHFGKLVEGALLRD